jgi:ATP-dependent helicase/DNAse subunit B
MSEQNPLVYVPTPIPEGAIMRFSPSQFSKFVDKPHAWYRSEVLGEEDFTHSTSTVIGTIVHYCAEQVAKNEDVDIQAIDEYIDMLEEHETYSRADVRKFYQEMAETLVTDYVLNRNFMEVESQHVANVQGNKYYAGGTIDRVEGSKEECMVVDYKTYNSKTKPKVMPAYYKYQLLVYAWVLKQKGYNVTRLRLVYVNRFIDGGVSEKTGNPLKSYPPEVTVITEQIEQADFDFIESQLNLAADTVEFHRENPHLAHIVWHDPRLRVEA